MPASRLAIILGIAAIVLSHSAFGLLSASLLSSETAPAMNSRTEDDACATTLAIIPKYSQVDISGTMNDREIRCGRRTAPMFSGTLNLALSADCPRSQAELVDSQFTFTAESDGATPLIPQDGIILSVQGARVNAKHVQVVIETTRPISVTEATFVDPNGLRMTITSGSVKVVGKVFDISGYTSTYGISGYFDYAYDAGLQLFVSPDEAVFDVHIGDPHVEGTIIISGGITACEYDDTY